MYYLIGYEMYNFAECGYVKFAESGYGISYIYFQVFNFQFRDFPVFKQCLFIMYLKKRGHDLQNCPVVRLIYSFIPHIFCELIISRSL